MKNLELRVYLIKFLIINIIVIPTFILLFEFRKNSSPIHHQISSAVPLCEVSSESPVGIGGRRGSKRVNQANSSTSSGTQPVGCSLCMDNNKWRDVRDKVIKGNKIVTGVKRLRVEVHLLIPQELTRCMLGFMPWYSS